ncbi:hypothetical protein JVU11DRAFT_6604 [Chiua virens]|nr:hypothetical protein JVU11DRAFT_6604 [Chiua virens]
MSVPPAFLGPFFIRKSVAFAGITLLLYDYLLTLPLEVSRIWDVPWTLFKVLFLVNRYGNLIGQTVVMLEETGYLSHGSPKFCVVFQLYSAIFAVLSEESIRILVAMRVCALLRIERKVSVSLSGLYALYGLGTIMVSTYLWATLPPLPILFLNATGICFSPVPPFNWGTRLLILVIDTFMFLIVYHRLFRPIQDAREVQPSQLNRLLTRDALLFYIAAMFNVLFTIVCWSVYSGDPRSFTLDTITHPFLSVIGQRLILNLGRLRAQPDSTRGVSREINRHITVMVDQQVMYQSDLGDWTGSRMADLHKRDRGHHLWASRAGRDGEGVYELSVIRRDAVSKDSPPFVGAIRARALRERDTYESSDDSE